MDFLDVLDQLWSEEKVYQLALVEIDILPFFQEVWIDNSSLYTASKDIWVKVVCHYFQNFN